MIKGFKIATHNDIASELEYYHKHGAEPGLYCGFPNLHEFYNMKAGGCTDWTGLPQSGKSQLLLELLYNTSDFYGNVHVLNTPDIGNVIETLDILIHIHTGKTFEKKYPNRIELKEAFEASAWILNHFLIIEQSDPKAKMTPVAFWEMCAEMKKSQRIDTGTIDSWKDMDHEGMGGNYASYLSHVLPVRNKIAEFNKIHFHTVIHPKNPRRGEKGKIYAIQTDDMEGGAQWNNSGKTIISVAREFDSKLVDINILKAKPRVVGKRGFTSLQFDPSNSRYYWMDAAGGGVPVYAEKEYRKPQQSAITPNVDFPREQELDMPF